MKGNGRASAICVPKLFMRATLANLYKAKSLQNRSNFFGLEYRVVAHASGYLDGLSANEFCFKCRLSVLKQHFDYFPQVLV